MQSQVRLASVAAWDEGVPALHGPEVYGASARRPFFYAIPTTGERPIRYAAEGLPEGLRLDAATGQISGAAPREGDWPVLLRAENRHGKAEKEMVIAIGRGLALTPPMGWNSWNAWRRWVDDAKVRAAADALVSTGLAARGYCYVNIDSCWQGARGGQYNAIQPNRKFPDMRSLADYVHAQGLKFGIYSTPWAVPWGCSEQEAVADWGGPGLIGCSSGAPDPDYPIHPIPAGHYVGLEKHEAQDAAQWAEWGVDFLKYDWAPTDPRSLERMGRALGAVARDIVLSICTEARLAHIEAYQAWAQMWRGIPDTADNWSSLLKNAFVSDDYLQEDWRPHIGPGAWHDLDMFALGPQCSTPTAWALYSSPLILSCDLEALSEFEVRLFANEEVIAVNQDRLGRPATRLCEERVQPLGRSEPSHNRRIWARPLADGGYAVGLFNLADQADEVSFELKLLGLLGSATVRNLWERRDLGRAEGRLSITVPAHGAQLVRVKG
jgi:alpha-galactosidase